MSFPVDPLGLTVEIAPGADLTAAPATWTWVDVSSYVRVTGPMVVSRGKMSARSDTVPASLSLLLDNAGGRFTPRNPIGPWYGLLRENTPIRFRLDPGTGVVTRLVGYVDSWPSRWDITGNNRWVPGNAHGIMRRLATAGRAEHSALYRYISANLGWARLGYWPGEDGVDARSAASADDQAGPMSVSGTVRFGTAAPLSGVSSLIDPSGGDLRAWLPRYFAFDWRVEGVVVYDAAPTTDVRIASWITPGTIGAWNLRCTASGFKLEGATAAVGGLFVLTITSGSIPVAGQLHHLRVDIADAAGTIGATLYVDGVSVGTATRVSTQTSPPTHIRINPDKGTTDVPSSGHWAIWAGNPASDSHLVALGRLGETAGDRMTDLSADAGVPIAAITAGTEAMGAQPAGSYLTAVRDAADTDGGLLVEATTGEIQYVTRKDLYNQAVALTLDYALGQVQPPFLPADDDVQLVNDVTAKRPGGSEGRYVGDTSAGVYEDTITRNVRVDDRLTNHAAWAVNKAATREHRFDNLSISLSRSPELVAAWLATDIGDRIAVTNVPTDLTPDSPDLILVGYTETIEYPRGWRVDMVCEPAAPYKVGVRDTSRRDTAGSTLATANLSAKADGNSATANVITVADANAVGFAVGNQVVLHDSSGYRKEPQVFTIVSMASGFGFTNITFTPAAEEPPTGTFGGAGDFIRRVDQTSLSVATTLGPLWTTTPAQMPIHLNVDGEKVTATAISGATSPQTFTVTRAVNGVQKAHSVGASVSLWDPARRAL